MLFSSVLTKCATKGTLYFLAQPYPLSRWPETYGSWHDLTRYDNYTFMIRSKFIYIQLFRNPKRLERRSSSFSFWVPARPRTRFRSRPVLGSSSASVPPTLRIGNLLLYRKIIFDRLVWTGLDKHTNASRID